MTDITISLPEDTLAKLREKASMYGVSAEELVRAGIDRLLDSSEAEFEQAVDYVLRKNENFTEGSPDAFLSGAVEFYKSICRSINDPAARVERLDL